MNKIVGRIYAVEMRPSREGYTGCTIFVRVDRVLENTLHVTLASRHYMIWNSHKYTCGSSIIFKIQVDPADPDEMYVDCKEGEVSHRGSFVYLNNNLQSQFIRNICEATN